MNFQRLGQTIETLREDRGLSRQELADKAGVHFNTLRNLETGAATDIRLGTLVALALALAVRPDWLVKMANGA